MLKISAKYAQKLTDLVSPVLYSTHGGKTNVRFKALAKPSAPRK